MSWQRWIVVVFLALSASSNILLIGEPRKPLTNAQAFINVIFQAALIALIVTG